MMVILFVITGGFAFYNAIGRNCAGIENRVKASCLAISQVDDLMARDYTALPATGGPYVTTLIREGTVPAGDPYDVPAGWVVSYTIENRDDAVIDSYSTCTYKIITVTSSYPVGTETYQVQLTAARVEP